MPHGRKEAVQEAGAPPARVASAETGVCSVWRKSGASGDDEPGEPRPLAFSVYVALTYIPGGGLLTGFAMFAMFDEERSERGIRVIRSLPPKRKSTATHRAHASIHLASRPSGSARLLRSTRGPIFWPSEAAAGHTGGSVRSSTQTRSSKKSGVCVKAVRHGKGRR